MNDEAPLTWHYEADFSNISSARRRVEDALTGSDLAGATSTAALVVSELATNALLHARTGFTVRVAVRQVPGQSPVIRIEVHDGSGRLPTVRHFAVDAGAGRGLRLIDGVCRAWGVEAAGDGKTVWAELDADADSRGALMFQFGDMGLNGVDAL